jgi:transcriptional regulator with GAF, ATPase, and Fis domain
MATPLTPPPIGLPKDVLSGWQSVVDLLADLLEVPVGIISRIRDGEIEILVASRGEGNPFQPGDHRPLLDSGLYCEEVVRTREVLRVKDGRRRNAWKDSPPVKDGWVAHLGYPLFMPGGHIFGTLCVQDRKARTFTEAQEELIRRFRDLVETQVSLLILDRKQRQSAQLLENYREELRQLRSTFPVCPSCRKIRNDSDYWEEVEEYMATHAMGEFGHGLCPDCSRDHWGETIMEPEPVPLPRGLGHPGPARA